MSLFGISCLLLLLLCVLLGAHKGYDDGLIGHFGLGVAGTGSLIVVTLELTGTASYRNIGLESELVVSGITMFLARHAWRWMRWRYFGIGSWTRDQSNQGGS